MTDIIIKLNSWGMLLYKVGALQIEIEEKPVKRRKKKDTNTK